MTVTHSSLRSGPSKVPVKVRVLPPSDTVRPGVGSDESKNTASSSVMTNTTE